MSRIVGYGLLVVAALMTGICGLKIWSFAVLAESGIQRSGALMEIAILALCGVVIPVGISTLLFKKIK